VNNVRRITLGQVGSQRPGFGEDASDTGLAYLPLSDVLGK
jgi:hypothetical protein